MQTHKKTSKNKTFFSAACVAATLLISPVTQAASKHTAGNTFGSHVPAGHRTIAEFTDYANVTHVQPVYRRVKHQRPTQQCWYEESASTSNYTVHRERQRQHNPGQTIVGGIVGGVIGNQIGRHTGSRKARLGATVAGAIFGSALANEGHARHRRPHANPNTSHVVTESRPVKHCKEVFESQYKRKIVGYNVTYRYRGRTHTTHMRRDPGNRIPVRVSVSPQG